MVPRPSRAHHVDMSEHTITQPSIKRLERSNDRFIAGVCGGLGRYFDMSPGVFRLAFIVLTVIGGAGILVYIAAALVIPSEGKATSVAEDVLAERRDHPVRLIALGLIACVILASLSRASTWPTLGAGWFVVLIAGVALLWATRGRRNKLLIAAVTLASVIAAAIVVALVATFAWFNVSLNDGVGEHTYAPAAIQTVNPSYHLGIGNLTIDASRLPAGAPVTIHAHVGIGKLHIVVPRNASVAVNATAKVGDIHALGQQDDGRHARITTGTGPFVVDAQVGAGQIDVVRAR
jgi:phage shock protein PspC (stress-responsive transcriptional regulator)/predicted membrane protein